MSYLKSKMELLDFAATLRVHINYERTTYNSLRKKCSEIETSTPSRKNFYLKQALSDHAFRHECTLSVLESLCDDFMYILTDEGQKAVSARFTQVDNCLKKESVL